MFLVMLFLYKKMSCPFNSTLNQEECDMKSRFLFLMAVLSSFMFFPGQSVFAEEVTKGTVTLNSKNHVVQFIVVRGYVQGLASARRIKPIDIEEVYFNSDRVGWLEASTAEGHFRPSTGKAVIKNTANNDTGQWTVELKSGEIIWFNLDFWEFVNKPAEQTEGLIKYGNYRHEIMAFSKAAKTVRINFNCNLLSGLVEYGINPSEVDRVVWNSDLVGWMDGSDTFALLQSTTGNLSSGNYFAVVENLPDWDRGNFSLRLLDGRHIWFNIDAWFFKGTAVTPDYAAGQIEYQL